MAARHDAPFTRGSTFATVMMVILVVGTIAVGVAWLGNREWGGDEAVADRTGEMVEGDRQQAQAAKPKSDVAPSGNARPNGPLAAAVRKSPMHDVWPTLKAPAAPELLAVDSSVEPLEPAKQQASEASLAGPLLLVDAELPEKTAAEQAAEGERDLAAEQLDYEQLTDGPQLGDPYQDLDQLESDLYSEFDPEFEQQAEEAGERAADAVAEGVDPADGPQLVDEPMPVAEAPVVEIPSGAKQPAEENSVAQDEEPAAVPPAVPQPERTEVSRVTPEPPVQATSRETIAAAADSAGIFNTFLQLAEVAELDGALDGETFYTVIAPTDAAFEKLPAGTVQALMQSRHRGKLDALLAFHLIPGNYSSSALASRRHIGTVNGQRLTLDVEGVSLQINGAPLAMPSVACRNGMLHGVNEVLLPVADNLVGVLEVEGEFSMLRKLLKQAGLEDALIDDDSLTLFAPTDDAFATVPDDVLARLVQPENEQLLKSVLMHHLVEGRLYADDLLAGDAPRALDGTLLESAANAARDPAGQTLVARANLEATNGVVHKVNRVLLPPQIETTLLKPIERTAKSPTKEPSSNSAREDWQATLEKVAGEGRSLYVNNDHPGVVKLYEQTMEQLLQSTAESELPQARAALMTALTDADRAETATEKAWVLRRGINEAYAALFDSTSRTGN